MIREWMVENQPEIVQQAYEYALQGLEIAKEWLQSPAALSQFALIVAAYLLARFVYRIVNKRITRVLLPSADSQNVFATIRRRILMFLPLVLPLLAYGFTAAGEQITESMFGSSDVIAFGKRVFMFLAARLLVKHLLTDPFLRLLGKFILIPIAALYAIGLLEPVSTLLSTTMVNLGNISFSIMAIVRGIIAGGLLFWLGSWSNRQSSTYISQQDDIRPSVRQLSIKAIEFIIFTVSFILLMSIMGINLSALAVFGGAIGVGLGFGLQKIASNFISGVILLLEGQATVGDYVELDGGEAGTIIRMTARATILESFDGRWIVVPNEDFITTRVVNYSDQGSANRYEAPFSVSYDTDINKVPDIVEAAVAKHKGVLSKPFPPDCELRAFGDSGVEFAVEFWVNGLDDGANKFSSDVLFIVWNALKSEGIEIPYPQRVVEIKGGFPS